MILRSGLLLLISNIVYSAHAAADAAAFFQIIYLQAVAIAFISASGFFRVQAIDTDEDLAGYLAATALMIPPSAVLAMGFLAVTSRFGLHGLTPYIALCGFQVISVVLLLVQIRPTIAATLRRLARLRSGMPWPDLHEASAVGALNVLNMLLVFGIRQLWVQKAGVDIGAAVLLTLRISDSVLQLFNMVMAGHRVVTQLIRSRWSLAAQLGSVGLSIALVLALGQVAAVSAIPVMVFAVLAQIALGLAVAIWPILEGRAEGLPIFLAVSIATGAIIATLQTRRAASP